MKTPSASVPGPVRVGWSAVLVGVLALGLGLSLPLSGMTAKAGGADSERNWDPYIWETPSSDVPRSEAALPLLQALRRHVGRSLDAGHLAPLRFSGADQVAEGFYLYTEPGRVLVTLGQAYPYLEPAGQALVREYVRRELSDPRFTPWAPEPNLPPGEGSRREPFGMDRNWQWDWARQRAATRPRVAPLYGLWSLSWHGADGGAVSNHWAEIRTFYEAHHEQAGLYGTLGAHLAMARWAHALDDAATEERAVRRARDTFEAGLSLATMEARMRKAYARHFDSMHGRGLGPANWFFLDLVPEAGRYLHDHVREPVLERHRALVTAFPHWWIPRPWYAGGWTGHESAGLPPEIIGMVFPVERWVVRASAETLAGYQPQHAAHGVGDCHAIEALVSAISAHAPERWVDVRPGRSASPGGGR